MADVIKREERRFAEFQCVRINLKLGITKRIPFKERISWLQTSKQFHIISPMVEELKKKDSYTFEHSLRVALMTYRFTMLISMSEFFRRTISLSAYCHDLGKLKTPDEILNKHGRLTTEEFDEIKKHPQDGVELLKSKAGYTHLSDGILYHQERWDGRGYPSGLLGEKIPFPARIIAVADSIDAMMSDRPYRKALTDLECRKEITDNKGIMYDPRIADVYLANWDYITGGIY